MSRLIDADKIDFRGIWGSTAIRRQAEKVIESQPTVDAVPVAHGRWNENKYPFCNVCMKCGAIVDRDAIKWDSGKLAYCPNCGGIMDGGAEQ